jgi:ATP-dependent RNA helicase RhlE
MHRIGRTGRAEYEGKSILLYSDYEEEAKLAIEKLMNKTIEIVEFPEEVEISKQLTPAERPADYVYKNLDRNSKDSSESGASFHEKKAKNKKVNLGGSYHRDLAAKYKKPKTRGGKKRK